MQNIKNLLTQMPQANLLRNQMITTMMAIVSTVSLTPKPSKTSKWSKDISNITISLQLCSRKSKQNLIASILTRDDKSINLKTTIFLEKLQCLQIWKGLALLWQMNLAFYNPYRESHYVRSKICSRLFFRMCLIICTTTTMRTWYNADSFWTIFLIWTV